LPDPEIVRGWHLDLIAALDLQSDSVASEPLTRRVIAKLGIDGAAALGEGAAASCIRHGFPPGAILGMGSNRSNARKKPQALNGWSL